MPLTQALLEAHLRYELELWRGPALADLLRIEAQALYAHWSEVRLDQVISQSELGAFLHHWLIEQPLVHEGPKVFEALAKVWLKELQHSSSQLGELLPPVAFEQIWEIFQQTEDLRRAVIHQVVQTTIYGKLVSEVLYQGIKQFLLSENNVLAKRVPGASKLLKFGQSLVNQALPNLEEQVEKSVKNFIQSHIHQSLEYTETFLTQGLAPELLQEATREVWQGLTGRSVADVGGMLKGLDWLKTAKNAEVFWAHFRQTGLFHKLLEAGQAVLWKRYHAQPLAKILKTWGISAEVWEAEVLRVLTPGLQHLVESGYLEQRLRERLGGFYHSTAAQALLKV